MLRRESVFRTLVASCRLRSRSSNAVPHQSSDCASRSAEACHRVLAGRSPLASIHWISGSSRPVKPSPKRGLSK